MSIRLEMLQIARVAPKVLGDSAALVRDFFQRQQNADGGFKNRVGRSDLYYTVFGLEGLIALQAELPREGIESYLRTFGDGAGLDFIHQCCLARCWAALESGGAKHMLSVARAGLAQRLGEFRTKDGGFGLIPGSEWGSAYGCFLGFCAAQDLGVALARPEDLVRCLKTLETPDGAWANERIVKLGSTNATAAAMTLLRHAGVSISPRARDFLLARAHPQGGFQAAPGAPIPDLLSTATALHALAGCQSDLSRLREKGLDFVDSVWTNEGAFHGHWGDDTLDCEYTYYGLLALGHLSLAS